MGWIKSIISRIAEEAHKSKIADLEKKISEMEKDHKVFQKSISDQEKKMETLENRFYKAVLDSTKVETALQTVMQLIGVKTPLKLIQRDDHEH